MYNPSSPFLVISFSSEIYILICVRVLLFCFRCLTSLETSLKHYHPIISCARVLSTYRKSTYQDVNCHTSTPERSVVWVIWSTWTLAIMCWERFPRLPFPTVKASWNLSWVEILYALSPKKLLSPFSHSPP